jgi:hypothetical protein
MNVTNTKRKSKHEQHTTVIQTINTPDQLLEYAFAKEFLNRGDWKGWHPDVKQRALQLLELPECSITNFNLKVRFDVLNPNRTAKPNNVEHWINRGWTEADAMLHIKAMQKARNNKKQEMLTPEYWVRTGLTLQEAQQKADDCRFGNTARRPEYWIKQGMSVDEAKTKVSQHQSAHSPKTVGYWTAQGLTDEQATNKVSEVQTSAAAIAKQKWKDGLIDKATRNTNLEYWIKKANGDKLRARKLLRERQSTFSLEKCIATHGELRGTQMWEQRQEKWQTTMQSKPPEELLRISRAKQVRGNGLRYGVVSQQLFWEVFNITQPLGYAIYFAELDQKTKVKAIQGNHEFVMFCDDVVYRPDFYIPDIGVWVEFDEKHHWGCTAAKASDVIRETNIKRVLKDVTFIRIKETEFADNPEDCVTKIVDVILAKHLQYEAALQQD